ncbi:uncharacterized protein LOC107432250 [Ziziphus jujuba]|uniref:Uncharacterized protein LOC107432250 n=2 Tax=Ziziphus jujuba TaxID=326968 RepID=A0A6P4ATE1_ZIZJJ|nr:uncharacterized protein LOC107432250 [Ziziphus jujuba]XP_024922356.1 uncharacterized protein LOC107432250 [Ziziphus jujuba var. spinosa]KAH7512231.1 hypothetical protein FEM48_Zijuj12G0068500 [Ziziphus jujuba var. spinosa]
MEGGRIWAERCFYYHHHHRFNHISTPSALPWVALPTLKSLSVSVDQQRLRRLYTRIAALRTTSRRRLSTISASAAFSSGPEPLDLTEDNIRQVLADARVELGQLFDDSVGITGQVELAELDGPFVKISLKGRFWHKRSTVVARLGNYLKQRIPEILEVDIEDEKQLDDSPENF